MMALGFPHTFSGPAEGLTLTDPAKTLSRDILQKHPQVAKKHSIELLFRNALVFFRDSKHFKAAVQTL